jgi:type I restriction enzyme S subunit
MSKIDELINQLCPNGVTYYELRELFKISRGRVMSKEYLRDNAGNYPVYSSQTANNGQIGKIATFDFDGEYLTWTTDGANAGTIFYRNGKFSVTNVCGLLKATSNKIDPKFAYYILSVNMKNYVSSGMGNPKLMSNVVEKIKIPIPPLAIQEEIVKILDTFTTLEAELEAELEARKKQYTFYRDSLLSFEGKDVEWKTLGEVGEFVRGNGLQKKDFTESGVGCIHYGQIYTHYGTYADKTKTFVSPELAKKLKKASKNDLVIAGVSENVEDVCKAVVWLGDEDICISGDAFIFKHKQNPKFIGYLFQTSMFLEFKKKYAQGAKVTRLQSGSLPKYLIPIPPIEEQERIANSLDKLDTLINNISIGLPAEIKSRRKQYEYYRNQLLTFNSVNNE